MALYRFQQQPLQIGDVVEITGREGLYYVLDIDAKTKQSLLVPVHWGIGQYNILWRNEQEGTKSDG